MKLGSMVLEKYMERGALVHSVYPTENGAGLTGRARLKRGIVQHVCNPNHSVVMFQIEANRWQGMLQLHSASFTEILARAMGKQPAELVE